MNPFDGMEISNDWRTLFNINERQPCRKCCKSRKYFCYTCYTLNADVENKIPKLVVAQVYYFNGNSCDINSRMFFSCRSKST